MSCPFWATSVMGIPITRTRRIIVSTTRMGELMSRKSLGAAPMSNAERSRRRREKAKAQAKANGSFRPSRRVMTETSKGIPLDLDGNQAAGALNGKCTSTCDFAKPPAADDFLAGGPEAIAARIFDRVSIEMARGIAMALQQRLLQGGCWPSWRLPLM